VLIKISNTHPAKTINAVVIKKLIRLIAKHEARPKVNGIDIVFLNNSGMRKINRRFLKHDYATDVLSFDLSDSDAIGGEIYISLDKAQTQAKAYRVTYENEILRLVAHGFLHILGYEDRTVQLRKKMIALGDRYISMTQ
jgi:probable rRNA maturation factor